MNDILPIIAQFCYDTDILNLAKCKRLFYDCLKKRLEKIQQRHRFFYARNNLDFQKIIDYSICSFHRIEIGVRWIHRMPNLFKTYEHIDNVVIIPILQEQTTQRQPDALLLYNLNPQNYEINYYFIIRGRQHDENESSDNVMIISAPIFPFG